MKRVFVTAEMPVRAEEPAPPIPFTLIVRVLENAQGQLVEWQHENLIGCQLTSSSGEFFAYPLQFHPVHVGKDDCGSGGQLGDYDFSVQLAKMRSIATAPSTITGRIWWR